MGLLSKLLDIKGNDSTDISQLSPAEQLEKLEKFRLDLQRDLETEIRNIGNGLFWDRVNQRERRANSEAYNLRTLDVAEIHTIKRSNANAFGHGCFTLVEKASQLPETHPLKEKIYGAVGDALVEEGIWTPGQYSAGVKLAVNLKSYPVRLYRISVELDDVDKLGEDKQRIILDGAGIMGDVGVSSGVLSMRNTFYSSLEDELVSAGAFDSADEKRTFEQIARAWMLQRENSTLIDFLKYAIKNKYGEIDQDRTPVGVLYKHLFWDDELDGVFKDCLERGWGNICHSIRETISSAHDIESAEEMIISHYDFVAGYIFDNAVQKATDGVIPFKESFPRLARALDQATDTTVRMDEMKKLYTPVARKLRDLGSTLRVQQICECLRISLD